MNSALTLDRTKGQWVDLGIHAHVSMTRPETCGTAGGAISLWMKVIDCPTFAGVVSSEAWGSARSMLSCTRASVRYFLIVMLDLVPV